MAFKRNKKGQVVREGRKETKRKEANEKKISLILRESTYDNRVSKMNERDL
jgi:hypothetical protein